MAERGLTRRLGRGLLWQAFYISIAVFIGIFAVSTLLEDVLIKQALEGEAEYFWQREELYPGGALPDTKNLTGFREGIGEGVPPRLQGMALGFHHLEEPRETLTFVSEKGGERLYLVFEIEQVDKLVTLFGLVPLALALSLIYLSLYSAYRVSRRAVSPVVMLAERVEALDPRDPDPESFDLAGFTKDDDEIKVLAEALQGLIARVEEFTRREHSFTRDASHELRTPLTVIRMASDRLLRDPGLKDESRVSLERIRKSADDMERLTAAFLLLARETRDAMAQEWVSINEFAADELDRMSVLYPDGRIRGEMKQENLLLVLAPEKVVESVIGNLMRNAFAYTDEGTVTVHVEGDSVRIEDTGPGMDPSLLNEAFKPAAEGQRMRGGFGVGLTIVKRMSDRFGWQVHIDSEPGKGTQVTVRFSDSRQQELPESS